MTAKHKKHEAWIAQAENDLLWGRDSCSAGHYAQVCFIAQQVGEKGLKALAFFRGFDLIKSHSIAKIADELKVDDEMRTMAATLDLYYISARYPDALPDGVAPFEHFTESMAKEALNHAAKILERVAIEMGQR